VPAIVERALPEDLYATVSGGFLIQVMDKKATKWNGVKVMLEALQCTPEETAYFGDDHDDVEPIRRCGMGVAMANAIEEAKAVANDITLSNDEDGVAHFLEQILA
jgi:hydroxymethylpyrimidine pyrophosphatase-like HAD family hydrolase